MKYEKLIARMTLEEKVSLLSGKDFWETKSIERLDIPSMALADGPHGLRKQAADSDHLGLNEGVPSTCFPTAATIANSWDVTLGHTIGSALGREAAAEKVNMILGPGLNIKRSPLCGRNFEYFSEDPYLSGKLAAGYIRGIQEEGVAACPKHFVANNQELFRMLNDSVIDRRTLHEIYLTGFEIAVKEAAPKAIMSAYNKINGIYANENHGLLQDILVDKWGFEGIVVSDWGGSNDHTEGVKAGNHLEMPSTGGDSDRQLLSAVESGELQEDTLDKRVDEYLNILFDIQLDKGGSVVEFNKHHEIAKSAAESSIVLLKNEDNILPVKHGEKVCIIGSFAKIARYQGAGSSMVNPTQLENTLDIIKDSSINYIGFNLGENVTDACKLASESDVVFLYLGLDAASEAEGLDRSHMSLVKNQIDLLTEVKNANSNIVVILNCGSAIEMPWLHNCKALVHGYLSGQAGAGAMLNVLTGKVNPSGKLAESYPLKLEDSPAHNYYPGGEATSEYREGLYVGYRYYDTAEIDTLFPFGYGLSYTSFNYSELKVFKDSVTFTLTNIGNVDGNEITQLYIGRDSSVIFRPKKELKGFDKIFLKAGESSVVTIKLDDKAFRYFDINSDQFEIEAGEYNIFIGASSKDIRLTGSIDIEGTCDSIGYDRELYKSYFSGTIKNITNDEFKLLLGHDIPESMWDRRAKLGRNDAIAQMQYAKSGFARLIYKLINHLKNSSLKKGNPDLNILFIYHVPFRGIEKMMGGMVSREMVDAILIIVNGQFFRGLRLVISGFFRMRKLNKITARKLHNAGQQKGEK